MDYGTIKFHGKELTITQLPYLDGPVNNCCYRASAEDDQGNEYQVEWDDVDLDVEDGSDSCNWNHFRVRKH